VVKYLVASLLLPFPSSSPERTFRVAGGRSTFQELIDILGEVQGVKYQCTYLSPEISAQKQLDAVKARDVGTELMWSAKPLGTTGFGDVEPVDNGLFTFVPETPMETFVRMYGNK
jgi:hypothetical protein